MPIFKPIPEAFSFPEQEQAILAFWERISAFQESLERRKGDGTNRYTFYDGPPFATGLPHYGHFVASTLKDVVPRYWTMRGKYVERRFGWDTHGLPIEMETEKTLGLSGPTEIKAYGIDRFNEACREGVLKYTGEWEKIIGRLGRWVDFKNHYKTMDVDFMESVWWVFQQLWNKGFVEQDFRVMPYSWRLSTPLSNFEANLDYRDVQDPAITVRLKLRDQDAYLLVWTTTPWTLPSNLAVAVGNEICYVRARRKEDPTVYLLARDRLEAVLGKEAEIIEELQGDKLVGQFYEPLFEDYVGQAPNLFQVLPSAHVTTTDGTGLVHMAPAFGQEDFEACKKAGIPLFGHDSVDEEGRLVSLGVHIKEADPILIRKLKEAGKLFRQDTIQHSYPYCWRSGTPLIYKALPVWQIKVSAIRERLLQNNARIHWVPESVGEKRFANWLSDAQDWCISRNRFWGCPIPIWICPRCNQQRCVGSKSELEKLAQESLSDLHSHCIDALTMDCECGEKMKRIPEVFDCWFESGSMPYAQNHYPFENSEAFQTDFPADFIAEGLDQTRGWFYTLLVLSTALFDQPPFKNVVVNGLVLASDGSKMSKSKKNYPDPSLVMNEYGADALRAYLINSPIVRAEPLLFNEKGVKEIVRSVMLPLFHAWSFFVQYANIDAWDPRSLKVSQHRPEIDRWVLSRLQSLIAQVNEQMESYSLYKVIPPMLGFIDDLTNWYIRRSRRRFWRNATEPGAEDDKQAAYATLYEVLVTFSKLLAPVLPFISETLYQNLTFESGESVHWQDYPIADESQIDLELEREVEVVRQVVRLGRALREKHKLKTRQPLQAVVVATHDPIAQAALVSHAELIQQELNVKRVVYQADDSALCVLLIKANFKTLGKRLGAQMREASEVIAQWGRSEFAALQAGQNLKVLDQSIGLEDVLVTRVTQGDLVLESAGELTVGLETDLTLELIQEGWMRETVSQLQKLRKDQGLQVTDRIQLFFETDSDDLKAALVQFDAMIQSEVLATSITWGEDAKNKISLEIEGFVLQVSLQA
ncbi:MAG: isoleucine--tRNA ligase [Myxococcaceae bacterium]|nr:isoleucine--tRNA ligase [Myxococcaceae bacterium]MBH2006856.1 isoleucine--tRNA ligase [Myxococcaceae bacterium]